MSDNDIIPGEVQFFGYRKARVGEFQTELPRELMRPLELALAKKANATIDNHTAYLLTQIEMGEVTTTSFWFTDSRLFIGQTIVEGRY